jgi:hypothetical protein
MDKHTTQQLGENGNVEYGWSNNHHEKITQFYFQLVRSKTTGRNAYKTGSTHHTYDKVFTDLTSQLHQMITFFSQKNEENVHKYPRELIQLYSLIGHTRDVVEGKGEYDLAFMQILVWYHYYPTLAKFPLRSFVKLGDGSEHPYGSWKDIKYFCQFVKDNATIMNNGFTPSHICDHPLIQYACQLIVEQLETDYQRMDAKQPITLAAKWCPREKGKFSWLYGQIVRKTSDYKQFSSTARDTVTLNKAFLKAKTVFRKKLAAMNTYLKTIQINMCGQNWREIDFNGVTSKSMNIYKKSFANQGTKGGERYPESHDRKTCALQFTEYIDNLKQGKAGVSIKGKRLGVYELVKSALIGEQTDVTNLQWEENRKNNVTNIGNIISMVDTSGSMECDDAIPLYNAIGLGIRTSECASEAFKDRVLTFSAIPEWVNLTGCKTFTEKVQRCRHTNWGMNTNFYKALQMILDVIIQQQLSPEVVSDMVLAVYSDMQIDQASRENMSTLFENIEQMYAKAGLQSKWATPYKPPHILFWNLRKTSGFPALSGQKNVTMLSGYSSVLLNEFAKKGMAALEEYSPYKMIADILEKPRYAEMENAITSAFCL